MRDDPKSFPHRRRVAAGRRRQRGMALIELALFGGILVTLSIVVIGDFGRMFMLGEQLTAAAEAGGWYAYQTWKVSNNEGVPNQTRIDEIRLAVINSVRSSGGNVVLQLADIQVAKRCDFCPGGTDMYNNDTEAEGIDPATMSCASVDTSTSPIYCEDYGPPPIVYTITVSKNFVPLMPGLRQLLGNRVPVTRTASYRVR